MTTNLRKLRRNVVLITALVLGVSGLMPMTASASTTNTQTAISEVVFECFGNTYFNLRGTRHELAIQNENSGLASYQVNYRGTATKDGQTFRFSERLVFRFVGDLVEGEKVQSHVIWDVTLKGPGVNETGTWQWFYSFVWDDEFEWDINTRKDRFTFDFDRMCGFGY